jgi:hypothetical protein
MCTRRWLAQQPRDIRISHKKVKVPARFINPKSG